MHQYSNVIHIVCNVIENLCKTIAIVCVIYYNRLVNLIFTYSFYYRNYRIIVANLFFCIIYESIKSFHY
jgi:hypothetical protein